MFEKIIYPETELQAARRIKLTACTLILEIRVIPITNRRGGTEDNPILVPDLLRSPMPIKAQSNWQFDLAEAILTKYGITIPNQTN